MESTPKKINTRGPVDNGGTVESIRSMPRVRPALAFRFKVLLHTLLFTLGGGAAKKPAGAGPSKTPGMAADSGRRQYARYAIAAAAALLIAVVSFSGLTVLARKTNPGDSLYFIKRAGERFDLAFTWDRESRAEKNLELASRRLSELEEHLSCDELDSNQIAYLAYEFEESKRAASNVMTAEDLDDSSQQEIQSRLSNLENRKADLAQKVREVAGAEGILEPAGGATVAVHDESGERSLNGNSSTVTGKTDSRGKFRFTLELDEPSVAEQLEVVVELDGRKATVPLFRSTGRGQTEDGSFRIAVEPASPTVAAGLEKEFRVNLSTSEGELASGHKLRLKDVTGSGLIDGKSGWVTIETDPQGRCAFSFTGGLSPDISRIRFKVYDDGCWKEFSDVLAFGRLEYEAGDREEEGSPLSVMEGFDIECEPALQRLSTGSHEMTITVRKKYEKLTDYLD